jgi:hypothetical protein
MARIAGLAVLARAAVPILVAAGALLRTAIAGDHVVMTDAGAVQGIMGAGYPSVPPGPPVVQWLGIPFAAPPLGDLRWAPPQPVTPWTGVRAATAFASECIQDEGKGEEDCLYLNVFAPTPSSTSTSNINSSSSSNSASNSNNSSSSSSSSSSSTAGLPVLLWVHGGGYEEGSASLYNACNLVSFLASSRGPGAAIVVTTNYRLNVFGFLGGDAMRPRDAVRTRKSLQTPRAALHAANGNLPINYPMFLICWCTDVQFSVCLHALSPPARPLSPHLSLAAHAHEQYSHNNDDDDDDDSRLAEAPGTLECRTSGKRCAGCSGTSRPSAATRSV